MRANEIQAAKDAGYEVIGINDRYYHDESGREVRLCTVLCAGDIGDYAAYQGIGSPAYIAAHGDKIRFEEACAHFPGGQLEESRYRR